jgi:hypothetical protein
VFACGEAKFLTNNHTLIAMKNNGRTTVSAGEKQCLTGALNDSFCGCF